MHRHLALVALLATAAPDHAGELAAYQGESIRLGSIQGVTYYSESRDGYRVVTTLADGETGLPVRFEAILANRQSLRISVGGKRGEPSRTVDISRTADKLVVSSPPAAADEGNVCVHPDFR